MIDPSEGKRFLQGLPSTTGDGSDWTPLTAREFAAELAHTHPHFEIDPAQKTMKGGMGAVYRARDKRDGRPLAIKALRHDRVDHEAFLHRFKNEIKILQALDHPHVVRIRDADETTAGTPFLVMEWLDGQTLAQVLAGPARLTRRQKLELMAGLCAGVEYVHQKGIIHRDLKAQNILIVTADGRPVILDFGVARDVSQGTSAVSREHGSPGTHGHMAPELFLNPPVVKPGADVYSLAVVFLEMITGQPPIAGHAWPSAFEFTTGMDDVVKKALSHAPADRYKTVAEFAAEIQKAAETAASTAKPVEPPPVPPARREPVLSPPPTKPAMKSTDTAAQTPEPPPARELIQASGHRLQLHRDFLANWTSTEKPKQKKSVPISKDERWEVIDQWDAIPDFPSEEEIQKAMKVRRGVKTGGAITGICLALIAAVAVGAAGGHWLAILAILLLGGAFLAAMGHEATKNFFEKFISPVFMSHKPSLWNWRMNVEDFVRDGLLEVGAKQLFWHPHQSHLHVFRDHRHTATWSLQMKGNQNGRAKCEHSLLSNTQELFDAGSVKQIFFSERSFMVNSTSFWWWSTGTNCNHRIVYDAYGRAACDINSWGVSGYFDNVESHFNPLRPNGGDNDFLFLHPTGQASLCATSRLPQRIGISHFTEHLKVMSCAKSIVNLSKIQLSEAERVSGYSWHPSGIYIVVEIAGRLNLFHWDDAELIFETQLPPAGQKFSAVGWSPDARLFACDDKASLVWDMQTGKIRASETHERWNLCAEGKLESKFTSCDGIRQFHGLNSNFNVSRELLEGVRDVAWSPDDPDVFATIGGKDCPRDIRIWQRVK